MSYRLLNIPSLPSRWRLPTAPAWHLSPPLHQVGQCLVTSSPSVFKSSEVLVLLGSLGRGLSCVPLTSVCWSPPSPVLRMGPQVGPQVGADVTHRDAALAGVLAQLGWRPSTEGGLHRGRRIPRVMLPQPGTCRKPGGGLQQSLPWPFAGARP